MAGFRHVVMFRWHEGVTGEQVKAIRDGLMRLPGQIPEIEAYAVGPDAGVNPNNFDFAVVGDFADHDAYLVYRDHPAHRAFIDEHLTPIIAERAAVQYELDG